MTVQPNESAESIAIRTQRRILMQRLNFSYPSKMYIHTLWDHAVYLEPMYEKAYFVKDLFYLQEKGYLQITENILDKGCELFDRFIVLTGKNPTDFNAPSGKEIAEQTMIDPAMKI